MYSAGRQVRCIHAIIAYIHCNQFSIPLPGGAKLLNRPQREFTPNPLRSVL